MIDEFRMRAIECLRWAQEAANDRTKGVWLGMAQLWLDRAESAQRMSQEGRRPQAGT
jgi:hypothetical protein